MCIGRVQLRCVISAVVLLALVASAMSLLASAQSQSMFYLHEGYVLDESAPTLTGDHYLLLDATERYVWKSVAFSSEQTFLAGTWVVTVWMCISETQTQYKVELGVVDESGVFVLSSNSSTAIIQSAAPTEFEIAISAGTLSVGVGESLAIGFLRQWQDGTNSPAAFLFFDSTDTPSDLISSSLTTIVQQTTTTTVTQTSQQETVTTTTQMTTSTQEIATTTTQSLTALTTETTTSATSQVGSAPGVGFAFVFVAVGAGIASALGGLGVVVTGRTNSQVFTYGGYYYCRRHRVPVWNVEGWLWCPVEQQYLQP